MASGFDTKIFVFELEYIISMIEITSIISYDQQRSVMLLRQGHFLRTKSQAKQFYCKEQRYLNRCHNQRFFSFPFVVEVGFLFV